MSSVYSMFRMDEVLEKEGVIINYGDFRVTIARAGGSNANFKKTFVALSKPYRFQIDNGTLSEAVSSEIMAKTYAESIIKNMEVATPEGFVAGVPSETEGNILPYTKENVVNLLLALPDLFRDLQMMATTASNYKKAEEEEDEKNSVTS